MKGKKLFKFDFLVKFEFSTQNFKFSNFKLKNSNLRRLNRIPASFLHFKCNRLSNYYQYKSFNYFILKFILKNVFISHLILLNRNNLFNY